MRRVLLVLTTLTAAGVLAQAPAGRPTVPELRRMLAEILASGYQLTEPPEARLREFIMRVLRALQSFFSGVSEVGPLAGLPDWLRYVLMGVLVVALALVSAHIVVGVRNLLSERQAGRSAVEPDLKRADPEEVLQRADAAFRLGQHDLAVRLLYLAVLLRLDRLGLLPRDPARTNWENLRALGEATEETNEAMTRLTREVDAWIYGGREASPDAWELARGWAEMLWRAEVAA